MEWFVVEEVIDKTLSRSFIDEWIVRSSVLYTVEIIPLFLFRLPVFAEYIEIEKSSLVHATG